ncbi:MAG: response regulator [Spirochaetota bacterium]
MKSILFVDDDINLLNSIKRVLHKMCHVWDMTFVSSSKQAADLLQSNIYDCVVVDYKMPEIDGIELLKIAEKSNPGAKRVLLSGQVDEDIFIKSKSITHKYLSKPCEPEELLQVLQELLQYC